MSVYVDGEASQSGWVELSVGTDSIAIIVNGRRISLDVEVGETLLDVLRDRLGLTGTKRGCGKGDCGACTVVLDGKTVNSCLVLAVQADGGQVLTIEGLARGDRLHPLQKAFVEYSAIQCGYCTPGILLSAKALLDKNPNPGREDIKRAIVGNLCRCTGYIQIVQAIESVVKAEGR